MIIVSEALNLTRFKNYYNNKNDRLIYHLLKLHQTQV